MLLDLIDKLIDRTIQLVKTDKEHRKELFERFVDPVFAQFEKVHQDYLASFKQYRDLLAQPNADRPAIIETIRRDHLFTADQRTKLKALARGAEDTTVASFVRYIHLYLTSPDFYGTQPGDPAYRDCVYPSQRWRQGLLRDLEAGTGASTQDVLRLLDQLVRQMQEVYGFVVGSYGKLKQDLLG
jgi:hypothetical protein